MTTRNKTIITGVLFSVLILVGVAVAVLISFRQTAEKPVAPTVPQVTPQAAERVERTEEPPRGVEQVTVSACSLTFTVKTIPEVVQTAICDSLTADKDSGTAPITVSFTLTGHSTPSGSIVNYKFDFGDGTTPVGQASGTISHTFTSDGTFVVKGTVVDNL